MPLLLLFTVFFVGVGVPAVPSLSVAAAASDVRVDYRQEQQTALFPPVTSSSSFDYWWPFPPGGVYATTTTTATATTTLPLSGLTSATPHLGGTSSTTTTNTTSTFSSLTSVRSSILDPSTTTSSSFSSATSSVTTHSAPRRTSFMPWLLPTLIVCGVVSTLLSVWFCYGFFGARRGPRARASSLEPGPRYIPPSPEIDDHFSLPEVEKVALNGRHHQTVPSRHPLRQTLSRLRKSSRSSNNNNRASRTITLRSVQAPTPVRERRSAAGFFAWPDAGPIAERRNVTTTTTMSTQPPTRAFSLFSSRCVSPDPLSLLDLDECEGEEDDVPYDTLRHKSIRRGILERLKLGTVRRSGLREEEDIFGPVASSESTAAMRGTRRVAHSRTDSDLLVEDVNGPENIGIPSSSDTPRKRTNDGTEWVAGSGFRIVEEYLEGMWSDSGNETDVRRSRSSGWSQSTTTMPGKRADGFGEDKYTPMPVRKVYSKGATPRPVRWTSTAAGSAPSSYEGLPRVDSSILPQSPPQIKSPELESQLLFTPSPQKIRRGNPDENAMGGETGMVMMSERTRRRSSPISAELLADVRDRYRCQNRVAVGESDGRKRRKLGRMTPAERFVARHDALMKVEEIVSRSWSERV